MEQESQVQPHSLSFRSCLQHCASYHSVSSGCLQQCCPAVHPLHAAPLHCCSKPRAQLTTLLRHPPSAQASVLAPHPQHSPSAAPQVQRQLLALAWALAPLQELVLAAGTPVQLALAHPAAQPQHQHAAMDKSSSTSVQGIASSQQPHQVSLAAPLVRHIHLLNVTFIRGQLPSLFDSVSSAWQHDTALPSPSFTFGAVRSTAASGATAASSSAGLLSSFSASPFSTAAGFGDVFASTSAGLGTTSLPAFGTASTFALAPPASTKVQCRHAADYRQCPHWQHAQHHSLQLLGLLW